MAPAMSKRLPWLKLYDEARLDKKLSRLTLAERGVWINLLCYANEQQERGTLNACDRFDLAIECADGEEDILNSTIDKLITSRHLIPLEGREGWLVFRTFAERQKRKASDEPEATRDRQQRSRASRASHTLSRPVTRDIDKNANVTRLDIREKREESNSNSSVLSSGEVNLTIADDAAATAATVDESTWTEFEARRVGKRIIPVLKLPPSAIDGLMAILQQYPHAPPYLEAEAHKCLEWCNEKKHRASLRIFGNWLTEAQQRRLQSEREHQQQLASMNGNGKAATSHATFTEQQQPGTNRSNGVYDPEQDAAFMERRAAARLVRQLGQQQTS